MAYLFDVEVYEDEELFWNGYEEVDEDDETDEFDFPENTPTEEELNDMYYYFNTYDDPIRMCNVPERFDR